MNARARAVPVRGVPGSVVLDSVNGAGCEGGRELFASLGVPYEHLYGEPHGVFARPAEPIPAHLGDLCDRVRDSEAVVGFAQDPDADRLVLVDERGVPIHEECTLALAATWVLRHRGPGVLVANLSTSRMIDRIAEGFSGPKWCVPQLAKPTWWMPWSSQTPSWVVKVTAA